MSLRWIWGARDHGSQSQSRWLGEHTCVRAFLCPAPTNVDWSRYNCTGVFGHLGCQQVFAPDTATFSDLKHCEDSSCPSCREVTCHSHGECRQDAAGCDCEANFYPSSSCSIYCEPKETCHGHGTCGAAGVCECDADYYPAGNCTTECNAETSCHGNGKCTAEGACECDGRYISADTCEHSVLLVGAAIAGVVSLLVVRRLCLPSLLVPAALACVAKAASAVGRLGLDLVASRSPCIVSSCLYVEHW